MTWSILALELEIVEWQRMDPNRGLQDMSTFGLFRNASNTLTFPESESSIIYISHEARSEYMLFPTLL